ncbi:MAG: 6-carboxytetrahydropterin synthase [Phycisphaerales bacterium]|nr:6-carboxytetrahydropterin synthase [Phycisphaerales bacterium]
MLDLKRTVRFSINPARDIPGRSPNGFAGSPSMSGLARHYEIDAVCRGIPDPATGYLIDIKDIDQAVRDEALPLINQACRTAPERDPALLLPSLFAAVSARLPMPLHALTWRLSPYYSIQMHADSPSTASIRQRFDFAASHRLHVPALSDEENRRRFGKCNNPSGHGHNYQIEPCIDVSLAPGAGPPLPLDRLERITFDTVIQRFDHKNLNIDTREFADGAGLNPTVENIARVCFELLAPAVAAASPSARLRSVTVWETDRTSCTYPA